MGNHFHLLVHMLPEAAFSDEEIRTRFQRYYGADLRRGGTIVSFTIQANPVQSQ